MRIALVGLGDVGKHHAPALLAIEGHGLATFAAVCARDAARVDAFRSALQIPAHVATFKNLDELIAARACDAIIVATPDGLHVEQAVAAIHAGLDVLVEKPLALDVEGATRVVDAARAANVRLAVGYHLRHHAAHRLMFDQREELVGDVRNIFVRWAWPDPAIDGWRAHGESARFWSLAALGTHAIDLALWFSNSRVTHASALREPPNGIDRAAEVSLRFESGAMAHVSVSVAHRAISRFVVTGDRGELEALGTLGARGDGELFHRAPRTEMKRIDFVAENPYVSQLRAFIAPPRGFSENESLLSNVDVLDRAGENS